MILEAFSRTLQQQLTPETTAMAVLRQWLLDYLLEPQPKTGDMVHAVVIAELELVAFTPAAPTSLWTIQAKSPTGEILLKSLVNYCQSYEDWQYRRWLHQLRASDFVDVWRDGQPDSA